MVEEVNRNDNRQAGILQRRKTGDGYCSFGLGQDYWRAPEVFGIKIDIYPCRVKTLLERSTSQITGYHTHIGAEALRQSVKTLES